MAYLVHIQHQHEQDDASTDDSEQEDPCYRNSGRCRLYKRGHHSRTVQLSRDVLPEVGHSVMLPALWTRKPWRLRTLRGCGCACPITVYLACGFG